MTEIETPKETHDHCCPGCGTVHQCARDTIPYNEGPLEKACKDYWPLPCSYDCARKMHATELWLRKRGIG